MPNSSRMQTMIPSALILVIAMFALLAPTQLWAGVYPDPVCEQSCYDAFDYCYYERCDQRGDCSYCWEDYQWCVAQCPILCDEPKSVRTYNQAVYSNLVFTGITACLRHGFNAQVHDKILYKQRINTYKETTHCDNSKTTELIATGPLSGQLYCWAALNPPNYCSSNNIDILCPWF
jgi:hypothetical protein